MDNNLKIGDLPSNEQIRIASFFDLFLFAVRYYKRFSIEGDSMIPTLRDGDQVLVKKKHIVISDLVVAKHPYKKELVVKRVTAIEQNNLFVSSDNQCIPSSDSRAFGFIQNSAVVGTVLYKI